MYYKNNNELHFGNGPYTEPDDRGINTSIGLKQGAGLAPTLLNLALEYIISTQVGT